jgi:hypothetical protein
MTYSEVIEEIEAYNRQHKAKYTETMQMQAALDYQLAQLIGLAFNDPKKYPKTLQKAYPELFKNSAGSMSWQASKDQFKKYAEEFNRQREGQR